MDFRIEVESLQRVFKFIGITAKSNTTDMPGLILITADPESNKLYFLSNSVSNAIEISSDKVETKEAGSVALEYGKLKSFVAAFTPWSEERGTKDIRFRVKGNDCIVTGRTSFTGGKTSTTTIRIPIYPTSIVKHPAKFEKETFMLDAAIVRAAINKIVYTIDPADPRPFLHTMKIEFTKDDIKFVGTNGKSLSEYRVKNIYTLKEGVFLFRYDLLMCLRRAITEEGDVYFDLTDRFIMVKFQDFILWGMNITGFTYPEYDTILNSYTHSISLDKKVLLSCLFAFIDMFNPEDNNRLTMTLEDRKLHFRTSFVSSSIEQASFEYDYEVNYDGKFIIDVDGRLLTSSIDAIKDEVIFLGFTDDNSVMILDSNTYKDQKAIVTHLKRR